MKDEFKIVKKMVKDRFLKNIVNHLEFVIFGYNHNDNDNNKKSKDNKTRTFAPSEKKDKLVVKINLFLTNIMD